MRTFFGRPIFVLCLNWTIYSGAIRTKWSIYSITPTYHSPSRLSGLFGSVVLGTSNQDHGSMATIKTCDSINRLRQYFQTQYPTPSDVHILRFCDICLSNSRPGRQLLTVPPYRPNVWNLHSLSICVTNLSW